MNKYLDILRENKYFDFENNNLSIEKVLVNKTNKSYEILFNIDNSLTYNEYKEFILNNEKYFKELGVLFLCQIAYENISLTIEEIDEYFVGIIKELAVLNPSLNVFLDFPRDFNDNTYTIYIDQTALLFEIHLQKISECFKKCGLMIELVFEVSSSVKQIDEIKEEIDQIDQEELNASKIIAKDASEKENIVVKNYRKKTVNERNKIKDIPSTQEEIFNYSNNVGMPIFCVEGEVFGIEIKKMKKSSLATIKITDYTDSIIVKQWLRDEKAVNSLSKIKDGDIIEVVGKAEFDTFLRNVVILSDKTTYLRKKEIAEVEDTAEVKRVELHAHTKMSNLDAVSGASDYINAVTKWGHTAMAFTDHGGVHAIPDIFKACKDIKDFKPIYGVELNYVNDYKDYDIAFTSEDIELRNAYYVVFDIETTGFSEEDDSLIEIAAVKMYQGGIIETFSSFIKPKVEVSEKIKELTSITDEMLVDAPDEKEVLEKFLSFSKDCILVAHNARFDIGMIYTKLDLLNIKRDSFPVIDTLNALRALFNQSLKRFNLKAMAKHFKVKQEQHHRAIDDTKVTAECFLYLLQEFYRRGVTNYNDINTLIDKDEMFKYVIPSHINILVKNAVGYKNLFKLLSDALTVHCSGEAILLKSVLERYREGLIISSGCVNGLVFQYALYGNMKKLKEEIDFFDIIEVQPPTAYAHLTNEITGKETKILDTIRKIIKVAKELGKVVVATSDCHYLHPDMKKYRDILIGSNQVGGGLHPLAYYEQSPSMHLRTTDEMLEEFAFLGDNELIYEIVVKNTVEVADSIDKVVAFKKGMCAPKDDEFNEKLNIGSIEEEVRRIVAENLAKTYGDNPAEIVLKRVEKELNSIITHGYSSVYYMSYLLVKKSLEDGYLVGSRGSVGSSLVATLMNITEINPLSPHYRCPKCFFTVFKMNEEERALYYDGLTKEHKSLLPILDAVESGYDLPDANCPLCHIKLVKDGHDIPFETFLGFKGDKVPDIDLNFSGEYQNIAHEYIRNLLGEEHAFRGGTVGTNASKNAYGYVKSYLEKKNIELRNVEIDRISSNLVGIKRSTGQHPGGIVVVPKYMEIYDITPIQYPADNTDNAWRTTHFDYHSFEDNLLKLDILGHDDPTIIKYMMDYVHLHQSDYPFKEAVDIPVDDPNIYKLFQGTEVIGLRPEQLESKVASFAVPEFGTNFVRKMLQDTSPKSFSELVKVSGLSHGTDVWTNNAEELVAGRTVYKAIPFSDVIGCRDDIMVYLIYQGVEPIKAFEIMEFVRRGNASKDLEKWEGYKNYLVEKGIKQWYIWSCEQIKYMFPKAHATAYVLMALRIAWFKIYSPKLFYSAYFTKRAKVHHIKSFLGGPEFIREKLIRTSAKKDQTAKDEDLITTLGVALEMTLRGIKFLPIDLDKSDAITYIIEEEGLRIPFIACDGLGEAVAFDIIEKRNEKPFTSKADVSKRTRINKTLFEEFERMGIFDHLSEKDPEEELGLFAFLD